jgi:hypothetical protein
MTDRLEKLKKQQEQLKARIQSLEAGQKTRERKKDTRRKILFGSLVLERLRQGDSRAESLKAELNEYLTRDNDRALFELPPLPKAESGKAREKALAETA